MPDGAGRLPILRFVWCAIVALATAACPAVVEDDYHFPGGNEGSGGTDSLAEDGEECEEDADCESGVCTEDVCQEPTCEDDVQNGGESDTDCGGDTRCPRCNAGSACTEHQDCESEECELGFCQAE
jgi:hypothetical protein